VLDQVAVKGGDLFLGDLHLLECGGDLLEGQVAALAAPLDQRPQILLLGERGCLGSLLEGFRDGL
jgi:hypothetical protein